MRANSLIWSATFSLPLTVILIHGEDLDDQVGLFAHGDAGEVNHELVGEAVADVDAGHAVALARHFAHRDHDVIVAVAGRALDPLPRESHVVGGGGDPVEAETLVVVLRHDTHVMRGSLAKVGTYKPALGDLDVVLCGIES